MAVRRVLLASLAALLVVGCGAFGDRVPLLTAAEPDPVGGGGCYLWYGEGVLIEDATAGTALQQSDCVIIALKWPRGYTARRSGGTIEVLDEMWQVVARTGRTYRFWTSSWSGSSEPAYTGGPGCVEEVSSRMDE